MSVQSVLEENAGLILGETNFTATIVGSASSTPVTLSLSPGKWAVYVNTTFIVQSGVLEGALVSVVSDGLPPVSVGFSEGLVVGPTDLAEAFPLVQLPLFGTFVSDLPFDISIVVSVLNSSGAGSILCGNAELPSYFKCVCL
jgi:hypothetical protein